MNSLLQGSPIQEALFTFSLDKTQDNPGDSIIILTPYNSSSYRNNNLHL